MTTSSTDPSPAASPAMERVSKNILVALFVIVCCVLGNVGFRFCEAVLEADEAEHNLQAVAAATYTLKDFIRKTGRWPKDVEELNYPVSSNNGSMFDWPKDRDEILKRVKIKFGCSLKEIAESQPESFTAVTWGEPCYKNNPRRRIEELIFVARETLKEHAAKNGQ
ncbi:MAG: hypothetical protein U0903_03400 [Planctomycetales bacterium]